jgi:tetratricopeptide (TPR) repeat protein
MLTINRDTGVVTWDVYTLQPDLTIADFRDQITSLIPSRDKAHFDNSVSEPAPQGFFGFLRRVTKEVRPILGYLPPLQANDRSLTGHLIFEDNLLRSLEIRLELPDHNPGETLPLYNRFLIDLLGLEGSLIPERLDRLFTYHANWGLVRTIRPNEGSQPSSSFACEIRYKTPQERTAKAPRPAPRESMPDIAALIAAQKAYEHAKTQGTQADAEARHLHLRQLLRAATAVPANNFYASVGSSFPVQQQGEKHFRLLTALDHYVQNALLNKNEDEVIAATSVMLLLEPDDPTLYAIRAGSFQELKRYDEALADFTQAIHKATENPRRDMKTGTERPGQKAEYLWKRGYVYRLQGNDARALEDFTESITVQPGAQAYNLRAVTQMRHLQFQTALDDFEKARELEPNNPTYLHNRGLARAFLGNLDGALSDIQAANESVKNNVILLASLAWVYRLRQELGLAAQFAEQAILLDPHYGSSYYSRGAARAAADDTIGALADFRTALERWEDIRTPLYARFAREMDDFIAANSSAE